MMGYYYLAYIIEDQNLWFGVKRCFIFPVGLVNQVKTLKRKTAPFLKREIIFLALKK